MIFQKLKSLSGFRNKNNPHDDFKAMLEKDPLNATLHLEFAKTCIEEEKFNIAYSESKTALALGGNRKEITDQLEIIMKKLPKKEQISHNKYYRFATLAREIHRLYGKDKISILDVGGGEGLLSQFVSNDNYCLVEPTINGISGTELPFADGSFDCVVSCHVLEHIPPDSRELFLDQLLSKARKNLILLNPFYIDDSFIEERLNLIVEITGADWAKEHLACSLPTLELVQEFAETRGLTCRIRPNGTLTTSIAMVFLEHYSAKMNDRNEIEKIHAFYNALTSEILDSSKYPTAYLVTISHY